MRPIEPASRARKWCGECACRSRTGFGLPPLRDAPGVLAADDCSCAAVDIVHDDEQPRAAAPPFRRRSASGYGSRIRKGGHDTCRGVRWWRAAGITATQAEGFGALGERLRVGVPPGRPCFEKLGRRPRKPLFSKKNRSSECAKVALGTQGAAHIRDTLLISASGTCMVQPSPFGRCTA